ncbi:protein YgfX [Kaarinaea lacus]
MSSRKFEPPLQIDLVPSKRLLILLLAIHLGAIALTVFIEIAWIFKLPLLGLLMISTMVCLHQSGWIHVRLLGSRCLLRWQYFPVLTWQSDDDWEISTRTGQEVLAYLLPSSTCHPSFVALNFRTERKNWLDRMISVVILKDAVDREVFRQLRVRLRTRFVQEKDN